MATRRRFLGVVRSILRWELASLAVWAVVAVLSVTQYQLRQSVTGPPETSWLEVFRSWLPDYCVRAFLSPLVLYLSNRYLISGGLAGRHASLHLGFAGLFGLANGWLTAWVVGLFWPHASQWELFQRVLRGGFATGLLTYAAVLALGHAFAYQSRYREGQLAASRLEVELRETELAALRAQIQPHFLFNALNTVSVLVREDPDAAVRVITRLSDLLRRLLRRREAVISLEEELALVEDYLAIERSRFGDRLGVDLQLEPGVLDAVVPSLILQPLVENAVRHGVSRREGPGHMVVSARRREGQLVLEVTDDGPGWPPAGTTLGIGLANTRSRLEKLYGLGQRLDLEAPPEGGARVRVTIPFVSATAVAGA